jgi:hypothetical protein
LFNSYKKNNLQELIELLMSMVFPPAFWESDCAAAFVPFQFTSFYATPAFKILFKMEGQGFTPQLNIDPGQWDRIIIFSSLFCGRIGQRRGAT